MAQKMYSGLQHPWTKGDYGANYGVIQALRREPAEGAIAIGPGAEAKSFGVAIGTNAKAGVRAVAFGDGVRASDGRFVALDWDLTDVGPRLEELEQTVAAQRKLIEEQREMLETLWFHPGMPGALEAEARYAKSSVERDTK